MVLSSYKTHFNQYCIYLIFTTTYLYAYSSPHADEETEIQVLVTSCRNTECSNGGMVVGLFNGYFRPSDPQYSKPEFGG